MPTSSRKKVLAIVLAGGEGKRLMPLTADRAKPAVPFGGIYRLIDFALSNVVNSGYLKVVVLTQYKSHSLDVHIGKTWRMSPVLGNYVISVPAQMRVGPRWFLGSADAIYQNLNLIRQENPENVIVFGADHIYRMDPRQMVQQHVQSGAAVTVAAVRVPRAQASQFGIIETGADGRSIARFLEKPQHEVPGLPDSPDEVYASMGNYVFDTNALVQAVTEDSTLEGSKHDIGGDIIPRLVGEGRAAVYDFARNQVPGSTERDQGYWRDVGTVDAYYDANMDLISVDPIFNLYNQEWPILTGRDPMPPAKFVFADPDRAGHAFDSMVSAGVIVSGGEVRGSVLSPGVFVHSYAKVEGSVLLHNVDVGRGAVVRNAIIDKNVRIPPNARIGVDHDEDRARGFTVTDGGIVVIGKEDQIPA